MPPLDLLRNSEWKAEVAEDGTFEGYAAVFGNVDSGRDLCAPGCFKASLELFAKKGTMPMLLSQHDVKSPIGDILEAKEDEKGLKVKGRLWLGKGIGAAEMTYLQMKGTGSKGLSIGYRVLDKEQRRDGVRVLKSVDLKEVSFVGYGMNPEAGVTRVKSDESSDELDGLKALRDEMSSYSLMPLITGIRDASTH